TRIKQIKYIRELTRIYWPQGLYDTSMINVPSAVNNLTDDQKEFLKTINEIKIVFPSLKNKSAPNNQFGLISWLQYMINDFFGVFVSLNISKRIIKEIQKVVYRFYQVKIDLSFWLEFLIINENILLSPNHIKQIDSIIKDLKFNYSNLHG